MSELAANSLVAGLIQQARSLQAVQEAASACSWVVLTALAGKANRTIKSPMRHDPVPPACWIVFVSHAHHVTPGWRTAPFDPFPQDPIRSSNVIRILPPLILGVPTVVIDSVHVGARCVSLPHLTRRFTAQPLPLSAPLPSLLLPKFPKCVCHQDSNPSAGDSFSAAESFARASTAGGPRGVGWRGSLAVCANGLVIASCRPKCCPNWTTLRRGCAVLASTCPTAVTFLTFSLPSGRRRLPVTPVRRRQRSCGSLRPLALPDGRVHPLRLLFPESLGSATSSYTPSTSSMPPRNARLAQTAQQPQQRPPSALESYQRSYTPSRRAVWHRRRAPRWHR
jgi:hypothetical protein